MIIALILTIPVCHCVLIFLFLKMQKNDEAVFKALDAVIDCLRADINLTSLRLATLKESLDLHIMQERKMKANRAAQFAELEGRYLAEMRKKVDSEPTAL